MKENRHIKIAGALQVAQGSMLLFFASWYVVLLILEFLAGSRELGEILPLAAILAFVYLWGGAQAWFGYALIRQIQWTTTSSGYICCVLGLIVFPHVISIYTLRALIQVNKAKANMPRPVG